MGKIKYIATAGAFNDINVILTENLLDKDYCLGVVTNKTTTFKQGQSLVTYTIAIGGVNYTYSTDSGVITSYSIHYTKLYEVDRLYLC